MKGPKEDEMVGWHHWRNGHEFEARVCLWVHALQSEKPPQWRAGPAHHNQRKPSERQWRPNAGKNKHKWINCCCLVSKWCPTLCDPMDYSLTGSSVHGILQARILQWVAISFSRGSSWPRDQTHISCIGRQILYHLRATWEAQINKQNYWKTKQNGSPKGIIGK